MRSLASPSRNTITAQALNERWRARAKRREGRATCCRADASSALLLTSDAGHSLPCPCRQFNVADLALAVLSLRRRARSERREGSTTFRLADASMAPLQTSNGETPAALTLPTRQ